MTPSPWSQDIFFQYPVTPFQTSCGEIDLPILYFDCSIAMALFLVDLDKAATLVQDPQLAVVPFAGGSGAGAVGAWRHASGTPGAALHRQRCHRGKTGRTADGEPVGNPELSG